MHEPFGKRNRSAEKPLPRMKKRALGQSRQTQSPATFYFYLAGAVLFIVFSGYALA